MMTYRLIVTLLFCAGLLAGVTLGVLYFIVDRGPSRWNRAARVISGLIVVVILSYGAGVLSLVGGAVPRAPGNALGWVGLAVRTNAVVFLWYLVFVYLTPHRHNGHPDLGETANSASS